MRKAKNLQTSYKVWLGIMGILVALVAGLFINQFSIVSYAETTGKITASSAKIRKDPSTSGTTLGSVAKDTSVTIIGKTQGSDGYTWYQVYADANKKGYIRSDLVSVSDAGAIPDVSTGSTGGTASDEGVTKVNPISATISGGETVRIRGKASTGSAIITTASNGLAVTVLGTANGTDGKVWYQITYSANGKEVTGFVRSDYATLSGELTPLGTGGETTDPTENTDNDTPSAPDENTQEPVVQKDYDTEKGEDGVWYLLDYVKQEKHGIQELFDLVKNNEEAYKKLQGTWKAGKIVIGILVVLLIAAVCGVVYLYIILKDAKESAYIQKVENETLRRRGADRARVGEKTHVTERKKGEAPKVIQTSGDRPAPNKPADVRPREGARPEGARPVRPEGARPVRPEGAARPEGARPVRPEGVARPEGARPVRPEGAARPEGARPVRPEGTARPEGARPARPVRNFTSEGDDFEFDFLNEDE